MEKLGGGGHINIAGAQVKRPIDEVQDMLKEIIDELYQGKKARNESNFIRRRKGTW